MKKIFIYLLLFSYLSFAKNTILVTISPTEFFVKQIVKNAMDIKTLYPDAKFELKYRKLELIHLSKAKIYFTLGLKKEEKYKDLLLTFNDKLSIIDLSKNINKLKNSDANENPYIWMDPLRVRIIAKDIYKQVIKIDPSNSSFYKRNYDKFLKDIDDIFLSIKKKYYESSDSIFVLNNHWLYYINSFKIDSYNLEKKILDLNEINDFRYKANLNQTKTVLVEKGFSYEISKSISTSADNAKIVENNIYAYDWKKNIISLTNELLHIKEEVKDMKQKEDKIMNKKKF